MNCIQLLSECYNACFWESVAGAFDCLTVHHRFEYKCDIVCTAAQQPHRSKPQNVSRSVSAGHVHQHSAAHPHLIKRTLCSLQQEFCVIKCQECVLNRVTVRSSYNSSQQYVKLLPMNTKTALKRKKNRSLLDEAFSLY